MNIISILRLLVGLAVLVAGRQLFWLFVGAAGFLLAASLTTQWLQNLPEWQTLLIALGAGVVGALLAVFLQRLAVAAAGFIVGGYLGLALFQAFGPELARLEWVPFVIGGVAGLVLVTVLFDWALIVLSVLTGANLIVETLALRGPTAALVFALALFIGLAAQGLMLMNERRQARGAPPPAT
jgi:hypothetical protein